MTPIKIIREVLGGNLVNVEEETQHRPASPILAR